MGKFCTVSSRLDSHVIRIGYKELPTITCGAEGRS
jgi:hypothetical protein